MIKKVVYYALPFLLIPVILLLCGWLDNAAVLKMNPAIMIILLFIIALLVGNLTPTTKNFDIAISFMAPLALFLFMFLVGLLDQGETHAVFDFRFACKTAFQQPLLFLYPLLALATFLASSKPFRIIGRKRTTSQHSKNCR